MAKFIKLTSPRLDLRKPVIVAIDDIIYAVERDSNTEIYFYCNKTLWVTETPDEILALIKEAG